jgi:hypothetical protein
MTRTEVLGVEVRQFLGADHLRMLDANLVGATAQAADVKETAPATAFDAVWQRAPAEIHLVAQLLTEAGLTAKPMRRYKGFRPQGQTKTMIWLHTDRPTLELNGDQLDDGQRDDLLSRLRPFAGEGSLARVYPQVNAGTALGDWDRFQVDVVDWLARTLGERTAATAPDGTEAPFAAEAS